MQFSKALLNWYQTHGRRNLPWRKHITPYKIWLSEIMLQQTQVKTVLDYFQRFTQTFPDIRKLAEASEDEVLHLWSGLGYYSRARNLHKCAKIICEKYSGVFPESVDALEALPGIGRSTAGAIYSISYDKPAVILDGNVKRVLSRYFAVTGWPGLPQNINTLMKYAEELLPSQNGHDYSQAIMDLGATVCTRTKPNCSVCPVKTHCQAYKQNLTQVIPASKPKTTKPVRQVFMFIIQNKQQQVLLEKRAANGIWSGLWCLPCCDTDADINAFLQSKYHLITPDYVALENFRHTFTHFHLMIHPILIKDFTEQRVVSEKNQLLWYHPGNNSKIGLPSPVSKTLKKHFSSVYDNMNT